MVHPEMVKISLEFHYLGTCWFLEDDTMDHTNPYQVLFLVPLIFYFAISVIAFIYRLLILFIANNISSSAQTSFQHRTMSQLLLRLKIFVALFIILWSGKKSKEFLIPYRYYCTKNPSILEHATSTTPHCCIYRSVGLWICKFHSVDHSSNSTLSYN